MDFITPAASDQKGTLPSSAFHIRNISPISQKVSPDPHLSHARNADEAMHEKVLLVAVERMSCFHHDSGTLLVVASIGSLRSAISSRLSRSRIFPGLRSMTDLIFQRAGVVQYPFTSR